LFSINLLILEIEVYLILADIFIKFKTAHYELGILVTDSKKIMVHYFKKEFFKNLLAIGSLLFYLNEQVFDKKYIQKFENKFQAESLILLLFFFKL